MQNNKKQTIEILSLQIRPIDSTSKLAHIFPGFELFDVRRDFIMFSRLNNIAVALEVVNLNYNNERPRAASRTFLVSVRDTDFDAVVASRTFSVRLNAATKSEFRRVDIPLSQGAVHPDSHYCVEVTDSATGDVLAVNEMNFYKFDKIPSKYLVPVRAWFELDGDIHYRSFDHARHSNAVFKLEVENTFNENVPIPEVIVNQYYPDGTERRQYASVVDSDSGKKVLSVPFDNGCCVEGVFYIEYTLFGIPFAGHVFTVAVADSYGDIGANLLGNIYNYTIEKGEAELEKREICEIEKTVDKEIDEAKSKLEDMVGLNGVKSKITTYTNLARFNTMRKNKSLSCISMPLHSMFLGSPGTGKTTVAKILGQLLRGAGVLSKGHVVVVERSTLIGQYYSSEAEKTLNAIEEAQGGILFIDEAYQLCQPNDPKDPGKFVIETLMTSLSDESRRDWMLVLAGYTEPMKKLFDINPGLRSRIPESNFYYFDDLDVAQLNEVAMRYFARYGLTLTADARKALFNLLQSDYNNRSNDFGNARHVVNIIETQVIPAMANRIAEIESPTVADLSIIKSGDIPKPSIIIPARFRPIGFAC